MIILRNIKMSNSEIVDAIRFDKLNHQQVEALIKIAPTPEELQIMIEYTGDVSKLGEAEQFFASISTIPAVSARLKAILFMKFKFHSLIASITANIDVIVEACMQVCISAKWKQLLQVILAIGNYLNGKKCSYGFTMDSLLKLQDTKSTDQKVNLLQYLVTHLAQQHSHLLLFYKELRQVKTAAKIDSARLGEDVQELMHGLKHLTHEQKHVDAEFAATIHDFLQEHASHEHRITEKIQDMQHAVRKVAQSYGEDEQKMVAKPNAFFETIHQFIEQFKGTVQKKEFGNEKQNGKDMDTLV